jgi:hypothetical protein
MLLLLDFAFKLGCRFPMHCGFCLKVGNRDGVVTRKQDGVLHMPVAGFENRTLDCITAVHMHFGL